MTVRFDDSLPQAVKTVADVLGSDFPTTAVFLRDASGALTVVLAKPIDVDVRQRLDQSLREALGKYTVLPSATPEELLDPSLRDERNSVTEIVPVNGDVYLISLVDRRIVGQDWNRPNFVAAANIPIFTFFSCKGGVGRSTALAIAASALSEAGKNVFVLDLDLEAPGMGQILLGRNNLPQFGALDYFVENGLSGVDNDFLEDCIAPSPLTAGRGLIEVMPAVGARGIDEPQNVLSKLGRALLDDMDEVGAAHSFLDQARVLVGAIAARGRSDIILVDARAGLSEASAAAVVGLGGEILCFGVNSPQTFESYAYLFAHLSRYIPQTGEDWRYSLKMVQAKAGKGAEDIKVFRDRAQEVFSRYFYEEASATDSEAFNFDFDDEDAPHYAWLIPFDPEFVEFDPVSRREQLSRSLFDRTFGDFTSRMIARAFPESP